MPTVVEVQIGKTTYSIARDAAVGQVGGVDQFVVVSDGCPLTMKRSNGQTFYVTYKSKRAARATALNISAKGMKCRVWDKQAGALLPE